jgi:hypothetical protein
VKSIVGTWTLLHAHTVYQRRHIRLQKRRLPADETRHADISARRTRITEWIVLGEALQAVSACCALVVIAPTHNKIKSGNDVCRARAVDAHRSSDLVASGDSCQLVARPDTEDGTDGEVRVNNAGTVKGVECDTETTYGMHVEKCLLAHLNLCSF